MRRRRCLGLTAATLAGLAGCMGDTEYTVTDVSVGDAAGPLALDVALVDAAATVDSSARLDVTLRNESDAAVTVRNTGVWPLGLLALAPPGAREEIEVLLLSDQYAETDRVEVTANSTGSDNEPITRPIDAGESVTVQYEIQGDRLRGSGTYTLRGYFEAVPLSYRATGDEDWTAFHPKVTVTLATRSPLP